MESSEHFSLKSSLLALEDRVTSKRSEVVQDVLCHVKMKSEREANLSVMLNVRDADVGEATNPGIYSSLNPVH